MVLSNVISSYESIPNSLRFALPSFVLLLYNMCNTLFQIVQSSFSSTRLWALDEKVSRCLCYSSAQRKEIQPANPKRNQSWIFTGRTDVEAPVLWPPDAKNWLLGKDPDAGKDWSQEENSVTEDEMVGWHHWLNGCEFEQALGVADGQGNLACCDQWGCKELDTTEQLNWTELKISNWLPRNTYSFCFGLHKLFSGKGASRL